MYLSQATAQLHHMLYSKNGLVPSLMLLMKFLVPYPIINFNFAYL